MAATTREKFLTAFKRRTWVILGDVTLGIAISDELSLKPTKRQQPTSLLAISRLATLLGRPPRLRAGLRLEVE